MNIRKIFSLFLCVVLISLSPLDIMAGGADVSGAPEGGISGGEADESQDNADESQAASGGVQGDAVAAGEANLGLTCKSALLMEASTGTVIYEQNPDEKLNPASITKIMTLLLIFDAIADGKITMEDEVTTSAYAKSMGGSQVFLEEGEIQKVETLIKCIVVASGNDASVAMAEYIAGSEAEFVNRMNRRAAELGMSNTHFEDCCGLTDSSNHYTTARDVAVMSRELITRYPKIFEYSTIWMENITHVTGKGSSEFGLTNTNKLLKQYQWTTGLKTGSTSKAKYCVSATARKDNIDLIAVVMAAPDYKARFKEAAAMLNYGYANCKLYRSLNTDSTDTANMLEDIPVKGGIDESLSCEYAGDFSYLSTTGENVEAIERRLALPEELSAPVQKGDIVGKAEYYLGDKLIGSVDILSKETINKAGFTEYFKKVLGSLWL